MGGLKSSYGWAWVGMGGHGWTLVAADGYDVGMGTNSKENVGLWFSHNSLDPNGQTCEEYAYPACHQWVMFVEWNIPDSTL